MTRLALFLSLAISGAIADLWTKHAVFAWKGLPGEQEPFWVIEPYVGIETAVNMGALFGLGQGYGWLFSILSIIAAVGICYWLFVLKACQSLWLTVSMGLVLGGIIGNLYDRLAIPNLPVPWTGGVRDWILFRYEQYVWPNFNIADSLLVVGAIMLAIQSFREDPTKQTTSSPENAQPSDDSQ